MKKILLAFAMALGVCMAAYANGGSWATPASIGVSSPFDGFYIAGFGGYAWMHSNYDRTDTVSQGITAPNQLPAVLGSASQTYSGKLKPSGGVAGVMVGYGQVFHNVFYFGIEVNGAYQWLSQSEDLSTNLSSTRANTVGGLPVNTVATTQITGHIKTNLEPSIGVAFRPGFLINPNTLIFGLIGYQAAEAKISSSMNATTMLVDTVAGLPDLPITDQQSLSSNDNKYLNGLRLGVGVERYFGGQVSAGVEYLYTHYFSNVNTGTTGSHVYNLPNTAGATITFDTSTNARIDDFGTNTVVGFIAYHFDSNAV